MSAKIIFTIAILQGIAMVSLAQNKFLKSFDTSRYANYFSIIEQTDYGYFCVGGMRNIYSNNLTDLTISKFDEQGTYLGRKVYKNDTIEYQITQVINPNSTHTFYACGGANFNIDTGKVIPIARSMVYKFNNNGDTLWTKILHKTSKYNLSFFWSLVEFNSYLYLSGETTELSSVSSNSLSAYVVKMDTLGNIIWEKKLSSNYKLTRYSNLIVSNNKIYLSGLEFNFINMAHTYSCNVNEDGTFINFRQYIRDNSNNQDVLNSTNTQPIKKVFSNGDYLMVGMHNYEDKNYQESFCSYAGKYNKNGKLLWEKDYMRFSCWNSALINRVYDDKEGNLYFMGNANIIDYKYPFGFLRRMFILKTTANGDSLWMKQFSRDDAEFNAITWVQNKDDGFTACGYYFSKDTVTIPGANDAWLMRVDSNGCIDDACTPVGIKEVDSPLWDAVQLSIYPNPAQDQLHIKFNSNNYNISVLNYLGQELVKQTCNSANATIYISQLPKGLYMVSIQEKGKEALSQRFIKN